MKVVVTDRRFPDQDPYTEPIERAGGSLVYENAQTEDEVIESCKNAYIILVMKSPMTRTVLNELKQVELIQRNGAGFDNVDIAAATDYGIPVSNIPGKYCSEELAEHAIMLMLAASRYLIADDRAIKGADGWGKRETITSRHGDVFGIIGFGYVGRAAVEKARGLGMDVVVNDPYVPEDVMAAFDVEKVSFDRLLEESDCVSLHAQFTAETHHLISDDELKKMKESAVLVNTARGPMVDEVAVAKAVESGEILGMGTDVYEREPPSDSSLLQSDRIVCTSHHGGRSKEAVSRAISIASDEMVRAMEGDPLQNVINPEVLKYESSQVDTNRYSLKQ